MKTNFHAQRNAPARGFAFSADIVLALILITSLFFFASLSAQPAPNLEERRITDQFVDDVFVALDHTGYVGSELDTNGFSSTSLQHIYAKATELIPAQYDAYLELTQYPVDINACRAGQTFETCFPDANTSKISFGTTLPSNAAFVHGRRIFLQQQPASQCTSALAPPSGNGGPFSLHPSTFPAAFAGTNVELLFDLNVTPSGPWTCDQNITVNLSITAGTGTRKPVDMMLVIDRSGSMSWESIVNLSGPQGMALSGNWTYVADGTAGLRTITLATPNLPALSATYNSPGTARDVSVSGNSAYLADGTQGLRVVNVTNPAAPASLVRRILGNDAYASATNGGQTFVATFGSGTTDVSNTGSQNRVLTIGQNSTNQSAAQSFIPGIDFATGASLYLRKTGSPPTPLTVEIRSTLNGAALASTTIPSSAVTTSYSLVTASFPSAVALDSGSTYYLVATTPSNDGSNYYQWGARSGNTYGGGQAYQNQTAQSGWDARFQTFYASGLVALNTSTPAAPFVTGVAPLTDPWRIFLNGTTAYVADGTAGIKIFDVGGNTPLQLGVFDTTEAFDAVVSGNYAYVADGATGLRILDISNPGSIASVSTYNTPGTAYAVRLAGNLAYVADATSVQVIDVTFPAAPVFVKSYASPYNYRDFEIQNGWGYFLLTSSNQGLAVVDLADGPKMDQMKIAASSFVDFEGWDTNTDQLGLVSYSGSATTNDLLSQNFTQVKTDINALVASGATATGDGINAATAELTSVRHNPTALQFQVLMSDGLSNTGANSGTAAINAANNNIIIYTIGFGADADATELNNIANLSGGKYYAALDQNALIDVYNLIAQEIQLLASDANLVAAIPNGTVLVDDGNGLFSTGDLIFDINTLAPQPWMSTYTFNIPCDTRLACSSTLLTIPSPGTNFQYVDANGLPQTVDWNVFSTQTFNYRDLNIDIVSGDLVGSNNTDLTVKVQSIGNLDTNAGTVEFYQGNPSPATLVSSAPIPALCGQKNSPCASYTYDFISNIPAEGELYAVVNPHQTIPECSFNNEDLIYCYSTPPTAFFTLDYWVWLHA